MFGIFKSVSDLAQNVVTVVTAPVEMAVDLAVAVSDPFAEAAQEIVSDVKSLTK